MALPLVDQHQDGANGHEEESVRGGKLLMMESPECEMGLTDTKLEPKSRCNEGI